ncbi:MAG: hypothetical protein ACK5NN_00340 [Sphingomonadaceae bacterium]
MIRRIKRFIADYDASEGEGAFWGDLYWFGIIALAYYVCAAVLLAGWG